MDPKTSRSQEATLRSYKSRVARPISHIVLRDGRVALRIHGTGARQDVNLFIRRDGELEPDGRGHAARALDGFVRRRRREGAVAL